MWRGFNLVVSLLIKGATSRYFESFFDDLNYGESASKPENNDLLWKKNTKGVILEQKGTRMAENGEDCNGLEMTILKSLGIFFKIHERRPSSFKTWVISNNLKLSSVKGVTIQCFVIAHYSCKAGIKSLWLPQERKSYTRPTVGWHHGGSSQVNWFSL